MKQGGIFLKKIIISLICLLFITLIVIGVFMGKGKDNSKDDLTKITMFQGGICCEPVECDGMEYYSCYDWIRRNIYFDNGIGVYVYNNNNNDTVRNNYFTFNGNTATTQNIVNGWHINKQGYTSDAFDFFKNSGEDIRYSGDENHMSPADAIYYLLHRDKTYEDEINKDMVIL